MPAKPDEDQQLDHGSQGVLQLTVYTHPWWHGAGTAPSMGKNSPKSSSAQPNGLVANEATQDGNNGQESEHGKHMTSSAALAMTGHHESNSQVELVGHTIVLTPYHYSDPQ